MLDFRKLSFCSFISNLPRNPEWNFGPLGHVARATMLRSPCLSVPLSFLFLSSRFSESSGYRWLDLVSGAMDLSLIFYAGACGSFLLSLNREKGGWERRNGSPSRFCSPATISRGYCLQVSFGFRRWLTELNIVLWFFETTTSLEKWWPGPDYRT